MTNEKVFVKKLKARKFDLPQKLLKITSALFA